AGVFDSKGRMLAQAVTGTPGHVNSMAESVKHFIRHFPLETMREGDVYLCNDPWMGTGHLNDFVLTTPCFRKGKLVALFSCTSHLMDIGGIGLGPDAVYVFMEGLYIPMLKLADAGTMNPTLLAMIRANTRLPVDTIGDVYSLANCNEIGWRRVGVSVAQVWRRVVAPQIQNSAGPLAPLTWSAPSPSILNAPYPLPVLSRHVIGQMLPDMVF